MTSTTYQRPPVWVGHVFLSVKDVASAARWLETVGLRVIVVRDEAAVFEMRGGTHVLVPHRDYAAKGLSPSPIRQRQWRYDHESFELLGPDGWVFTVNSSHVGDLPV